MPTYEYQCPEGHSFEVFQRMSDDPVAACPECGATARRKISGGAGFLFRGEGFYITDYRSDDYKKKASAETDAPSKSSGSETKSDGGKDTSGAKDTASTKKSGDSGSKSTTSDS